MLATGKAFDIEHLADGKMPAAGNEAEPLAEGIVVAQNGLISGIEHMADAILAARSLTVEFVDENEEVMKRLEGELTVVR